MPRQLQLAAGASPATANITWKSGRVRQAARRLHPLHHLLEGDVLVLLRLQRPRLHPPQQLRHRGRAGQVHPQRQRVDEEADQPLDLALGRGWRVGVPTTTSSWPDSRASTAAQPASSVMNSVVPCRCASVLSAAVSASSSSTLHRRAGEVLPRRARAVGRAAPAAPARRPASASSTPPAPPGRRPFHPAAVPRGVVGVLHRQRRERIGLAAREGGVQRAQLAVQHAHRPAVGDDVVHRQQQHVVVRRHAAPAARGSAARAPGRTARPPRPAPGGAARPPRPARHGGRAPPAGTRSPRPGRCAGPARRPPPAKVVRSASWRATMRSSARTSAPRSSSPRSRRRMGMWYAAPGAAQLLQEPQPLLRERERERRRRAPPARSPVASARAAVCQPAREVRQHRAARTASRGEASTPSACRTRETTRTASSECPPSSKKWSRAAHPLRAQHLGPDRRHRLAPSRPPAPRTRARRTRRRPGAGSALRSSLPFGVSGSASSRTYAAGTMYSGRRSAEMRAQRLRAGRSSPAQYATSRRSPGASSRASTTASRTPACSGSRASISPSSMRKPRTFTWSSRRPRNSERPVRPPAHQVARAVQPRARLAAERVGDEALRRQPRPAQVAARHARAAHVQLARHADAAPAAPAASST